VIALDPLEYDSSVELKSLNPIDQGDASQKKQETLET
jgi:hypothetical protein